MLKNESAPSTTSATVEAAELPRTLRVFKVKSGVTAGVRMHTLICHPGPSPRPGLTA